VQQIRPLLQLALLWRAVGATPTTSSYAVLGLLALRPWTAYELNKQVGRSLRWVWPRSERHVYDEPKRLVRQGWATARPVRKGMRTRTEYRITPAGRRALAAWLATPPASPMVEIEGMLRLIHADHGEAADLVAALRSTVAGLHTEAVTAVGPQVADYLDTGGPFAERLHIIALHVDFYRRFVELLDDWTADAVAEIERWPSTRGVGLTAYGRDVFEGLAAWVAELEKAQVADQG
jgi:DNA-binding PadR family transcriptional regulator